MKYNKRAGTPDSNLLRSLEGQALAKYQQLLITAEREIGSISQWELRRVGQKANPLLYI